VDVDGGMAHFLASPGLMPDQDTAAARSARSQGCAVAKKIADDIVVLRDPGQGFNPCLVSVNGTVFHGAVKYFEFALRHQMPDPLTSSGSRPA
jgi:hypothetical protein